MKLSLTFFVLLVIASAAGCSLLIDAGRDQCSTAGDCTRLGLGDSCEQGVCVGSMTSAATKADDEQACDGGACAGRDGGAPEQSATPGACSDDADCEGDDRCYEDRCAPGAVVGRFICDSEEPAEADAGLVHFTMAAREFVSQEPPKNLRALACLITDVTCEKPVAEYVDYDGMAVIELDLPHGFDGFLEVRTDDTLTALWYFTEPYVESHPFKDLGVVAPASLELLAAITGYTIDTTKGQVVLEAFDCAGTAAGGIHFEESKRSSTPFYIIDSSPSAESTITVFDDNTDNAPGGFINATPGFTLFTARIGVDGPVMAQFNAHVRANTVTYVDLHP